MSLDELQQAWQSQDAPKLRIDPELLLKEMVRKQKCLKSTLFWRDFREVFVGLALVPVSWYIARSGGWVWLSLGVGGLWIAGYILIDRWRRRRRGPAPVERSLAACVDESLNEVEHQIWLLKNVTWWYLLPGFLSCMVPVVYMMAMLPAPWLERAGAILILGVMSLAVDASIYWLNQYAVRTGLEPRRQELLAVRESLRESQD